MTVAAPFKLHNDYDSVIGEFNIKFDSNKNSVKNLIEFAREYADRRINLEFVQEVDVSVVSVASAVNQNIYVRLKDSDYLATDQLKKHGYKFFFDYQTIPVCNFTILDTLVSLGVSDVYLSDDLCYNMRDVRGYLKEHGIQSRLVLNHIPCSSFDRGTNKKSPIYRPQDIDLLSEYIDVFEFDCGSPFDWVLFDVLYRTWFEKKKWNGDLREINQDLQIEFPNSSIVPNFTEYKINCGRRCCQRASNLCRKCDQLIDLGVDLSNKSIKVKQDG